VPYANQISAADAAALIPQEVSAEIIKNLTQTNPLLSMAKKLPNMSRAQRRLPVASALATAYFVSGATGLKQTTEINWANRFIDAEEVAAIIPVPNTVLDDADYDIWGECRPALEEAFGIAIAQAVLYGTNIPATWTTNIGAAGLVAGCVGAGHDPHLAAYTDLYEALLGETVGLAPGAWGLVEADGFAVNGWLAHLSMKGKLRNCRDVNGQPIFKSNMTDATRYDIEGVSGQFPADGSIVFATSHMIAGDWSQLVYAIRQDMTFTIATEGVIQDAGGNIVYNLFQQDMVALRAVMRLGFALPNPVSRMAGAAGYPFAVLVA
jgi:HK97 family phage major capsid protein